MSRGKTYLRTPIRGMPEVELTLRRTTVFNELLRTYPVLNRPGLARDSFPVVLPSAQNIPGDIGDHKRVAAQGSSLTHGGG